MLCKTRQEIRWIMIGIIRAKNLCFWKQNVYIVVSENIVTARRKWSHQLVIDYMAVYVVHTKQCTALRWIPRFYYVYPLLFRKNMLLLALQVYHSLNWNCSLLLSGNSRGMTLDNFTAF